MRKRRWAFGPRKKKIEVFTSCFNNGRPNVSWLRNHTMPPPHKPSIVVTQKNMFTSFNTSVIFFKKKIFNVFSPIFCGKMTHPRLSNREPPPPNCTKQPCNTCAPCQNTRKCPTIHFPLFSREKKKPLLQQFVLQRGKRGKGR